MPDGRIVVASKVIASPSVTPPKDLVVIRFLPDGALDTTFGTGGMVWLDLASAAVDEPVALLPVPGGGLILAARSGPSHLPQLNANALLVLAKLDAKGALDPTFSEDGILATGLIGTGGAESLALLGTDRLAAVGTTLTAGVARIGVAKVFLNGSPDGAMLLASPGSGQGAVIVNGTDERILAAGTNETNTTVWRWTAAGVLEPDFPVSPKAAPVKARMEADGAVTVWANASTTCYQFGYAPNGTVDGSRTKTETIFGGLATGLALDAAGRLLWQIGSVGRASVLRMRSDFRTDASFGFWGRAPLPNVINQNGQAVSVLALPDGDLLLIRRNTDASPLYGRIQINKLAGGEDRPVLVVKAGERLSPAAGSFPGGALIIGGGFGTTLVLDDRGGISPQERGIASGMLVNVGEATPDRPAVWRFPVRNVGSAPLTNLAVSVTEGSPDYVCSSLPTELQPGEEAFVTVTLDPKRTGLLTGRVLIVSQQAAGPFEIGFTETGKLATVSFVNAEVRGKESDGRVLIPLRLGRPLQHEVRIEVGTPVGLLVGPGSSETAGRPDYSISGAAVLPPGTTEATISVDLQADGLPEGTEFGYIRLISYPDLAVGERAYTTLVIEDDSFASFDRNEISVAEESELIQVPVRLNRPASRELLVPVMRFGGALLGGTATDQEDFRIPGSQRQWIGSDLQFMLRFPPGETTAWLPLEILRDAAPDDGETIYLNLVPLTIVQPNPPVQRGAVPGITAMSVRIREGGAAQAPSIPFPFGSFLVRAGHPALLGGVVLGTRPMSASWTRNALPLNGATSTSLPIASVRLSDAGTYNLTVSNASGTVNASPMTLSVVDTRAQPARVVALGAEVRLTAPAAGPGLSFRWSKDGVPISGQDSRFRGLTAETLELTGATASDSGIYACEVRWEGQTLRSGDQPVAVIGAAPVLRPMESVTLVTGRAVSLRVPFDEDPLRYPARFEGTGIPRGLALDPVTGQISGSPSRPGDYSITVRASNPAGESNRISATLRVRSAFEPFAGEWMAWVTASNDPTGFDLGGRLNFNVSSSGAVSGSLRLGPDLFSWRATLKDTGSEDDVSSLLEVSIPRGRGGQALGLSLNLAQDLALGELGASTSPNVNGWRKVWKGDWLGSGAASRLATSYVGYHLFSLPAHESLLFGRRNSSRSSVTVVGGGPPELGTGFGSLVVGLDGSVFFQGQTGDGQRFTAGSLLGPEGQLGIFASVYGGRGALCGTAEMAADAEHRIRPSFVGQTISWMKRPEPKATLAYPDGIGQWVDMEGARYVPPTDWSTVLCSAGGAAATAIFHGPEVAAGSNPYLNDFLSLPFRIEPTSVTLPKDGMPRLSQFRFQPRTGFFTASLQYLDRRVPCAGVLINCAGAGFVRLPIVGPDDKPRIVHGTLRIEAVPQEVQ
jgi:uncharacterized delta-60 repeat protein